MVEPSDEALARQAQAGDVEAFAALVQRYQRTMLNVAYRMLGDPQDAEDIAQEVFLRAYQALGGYDPARPFFSWIYRIAVNRCLTAREQAGRAAFGPLPEWLADPRPSPEQRALRGEAQAAVTQALRRLSDRERALVALRYGADLAYDQIAATLGLPLGTVKTGLFRARQRLALLLSESGDDHDPS